VEVIWNVEDRKYSDFRSAQAQWNVEDAGVPIFGFCSRFVELASVKMFDRGWATIHKGR
jgi:hypothetical protein